MKRVYTAGVFDILHQGHLNVLTQAAGLGELTVGVMTDKGVLQAKGAAPVLSLDERMAQLRVLPFVSKVQPYTSYDSGLASVDPDILVQGDDWLHSADRSSALDYVRGQGIRLVLLPRTEGISSTDIKRRIAHCNRRDKDALRKVQLLPIAELSLYERFEEAKVAKLVQSIDGAGVFHSPIVVGAWEDLRIVVDGNNRLEALRRLGALHVPALTMPYRDIDLAGNVHFMKGGRTTRMSEFAEDEGKRVEFPARTHEQVVEYVRRGEMIPNGETWHRPGMAIVQLPVRLLALQGREQLDFPGYLEHLMSTGKVRYYPANVYTCSEW